MLHFVELKKGLTTACFLQHHNLEIKILRNQLQINFVLLLGNIEK